MINEFKQEEVVRMLTSRQKEVLELIGIFIEEHGYSPTVRELADLCGVRSSSTMHGYLDRLEKAGYICKHDTLPRTLRVIKKPS